MAIVPVQAGPRSERMSPNRLEATTTSNRSGFWTKCAVRMSIWYWSVVDGTRLPQRERQSVPHLFEDRGRDQDIARIRSLLEPDGQDDTVTVDVAAFDDDLVQMNADAQNDRARRIEACVGFLHALLQLLGADHGLGGAGELDEKPVPHHLD